ncbi:hypothetical protein [Amycolatopsis nalaikhensis]|uniref:Helix-turn-helix domain-containing protein n=1 Tax=Amycolatopsis nalaikhensis TaxID=715472 RepID=A0ABY8XTM7_9PSEU|nr:hypothetical protein [Amycolatopsis sp. 2-2]WIV59044.1 hypothetical protein QP939_10630 [Amycolatopsis sp. 2-2]
MSTVRYLGMNGLAERLGVTRHAVDKWRRRYPADSAHPFPEPDVEIDGGVPGWLPERLPEIELWREGMPGRGAGGGRPTLRPADEPGTPTRPALEEWERDLLDGGPGSD